MKIHKMISLIITVMSISSVLSKDPFVYTFNDMFGGYWQRMDTRKNCPAADDLRCPKKSINFFFFNSTVEEMIQLDQFNLESLEALESRHAPLKVIIHGYKGRQLSSTMVPIIQAYLGREYNVISVGWGELCAEDCYYQATLNVKTVGRCVAQFLEALLRVRKFPSVHLIGYSLGAHVASRVTLEMSVLVDRVTELEPAYPLFGRHSQFYVSAVADFVDVYHTNINMAGRPYSDGDVEVYFNNGSHQPGCQCSLNCSHMRSVHFFAESISRAGSMVGFPCDGWSHFKKRSCAAPSRHSLAVVGEDVDHSLRGQYMVFTEGKSPYMVDSTTYLSPFCMAQYRYTLDICTRIRDRKYYLRLTNLAVKQPHFLRVLY